MSLNGTRNKLSRKQRKAIPALLSCPNIVQAADVVGIHKRTLYRWLGDPEFRAELYRAEGDLLDNTTRRLLQLSDQALDVLEMILDNPEARTAQRRMAATAVLDHLVRLREVRSIEFRLLALEQRVYDRF